MKYLTIIRHAKAKERKPDEADFDRHLRKKGVSASYRLGELLAEKNCVPDAVFTSPAIRARQTAEGVGKAVGFDELCITELPLLYDNDIAEIARMLKELPDDKKQIFIVGHNPSSTELANFLCGPVIANMKTGSAAVIELNVGSWAEIVPGEGSLDAYITT